MDYQVATCIKLAQPGLVFAWFKSNYFMRNKQSLTLQMSTISTISVLSSFVLFLFLPVMLAAICWNSAL